jgi:hypothetical protein
MEYFIISVRPRMLSLCMICTRWVRTVSTPREATGNLLIGWPFADEGEGVLLP